MPTRIVDRITVMAAIAFIAASFGDPLVEVLGTSGLFGPGYRDVNHLGVAPALCIGLVFAVTALVRRIRARHVAERRRDTGLALARVAAGSTDRRSLLGILAVELVAVWSIEEFEALISGPAPAHPAGLFGWLGGPVLIALAIHAVIVWSAVRASRALAGASLDALARLITVLDRLVATLTRPTVPPRVIDTRPAAPPRPLPERSWLVHGMRAPPVLACVRP